MIAPIDNDTAIQFLKKNKASKELVFYRPQHSWYGMYINGELIAVGGYSIKNKVAHLGGFCVKEKIRGKGIGQNFVIWVIAILFTEDINKIVSYSRPTMAHILEKHNKFKTVQVLKNGTKKQILEVEDE